MILTAVHDHCATAGGGIGIPLFRDSGLFASHRPALHGAIKQSPATPLAPVLTKNLSTSSHPIAPIRKRKLWPRLVRVAYARDHCQQACDLYLNGACNAEAHPSGSAGYYVQPVDERGTRRVMNEYRKGEKGRNAGNN